MPIKMVSHSALAKTVTSIIVRPRLTKSIISQRASKCLMSLWNPPSFKNEDICDYAKGSPERDQLTQALRNLKTKLPAKIPITVGGTIINSETNEQQVNPSRHSEIIAHYASATPENVNSAIDAALRAKPAWEAMPFEDRAAIFLRACELIMKKYKAEMVVATMLGQGKNIYQAEIDAAAETVDFFRYYVQEAMSLFAQQPKVQPDGVWNKLEYRPLEGFVYAIAPFNFTALGATLVGPAALMGNVVIWKPSPFALHSAWLLYQALLEAGLPQDVIQFVPGDAEQITNTILKRKEFAGVSYIGSTAVFKKLQQKIGQAVGEETFASYPRIVGETSGQNWTIVHKTADVRSAVLNVIRSAFEYQGQKCSALSRLYVSESVWPEFERTLKAEVGKMKMGDPEDYENFINSVIHERSFDRLRAAIEKGKEDPELELITGGNSSKDIGYFVEPTVFKTSNPKHDLMSNEYFGPLLCTYVFKDDDWTETLKLVDGTSTFALTGSIFARDPYACREAQNVLKHAAGMLYINTKCTGSVVAQQPFGGSRDSGTNDKTGTAAHLQRWVSTRTIKEDFGSLDGFTYPSNEV